MGCLAGLCGSPAWAAIYGVPTDLNPNGTTSASSVDPPGFFILTGRDSPTGNGDTVHQLRLFIEVTGDTLDVRIFDAGGSGARDILLGSSTSNTRYRLYDPSGAVICTRNGADDNAVTQNRLARLSSATCALTAADAGTTFSVSPGLYVLEAQRGGDGAANVFGVDIRDASGSHYNVYTIASSDTTSTGTPGASETSMLMGAVSGGAPQGNITQPSIFYPYVSRGCTIQTSNFDADGVGDGTLTDVLGAATGLTMSGGTVHVEDAVTVENAAATNLESINYGIYSLTHDTGSQNNLIDWRVADFTGWTNNPGSFPRNPSDPVRIYLPNGYAPVTGDPGATPPSQPILAGSARVVSGANPPVAGSPTTYTVTSTVDNPTGNAISGIQVTVGIPAPATFAGDEDCFVDGVSATTDCTFTDSGGGTPFWRRVTLDTSLAAGGAFTLNFDVTLTPPAAGLQSLTGAPTAGSPPPNTTVWAQYAPASSSATFPRTEILGPICNLVVDVGGGALATRATLRGLRVDPGAGVVEFATGSQRNTAAFRLYGTDDPAGRRGRRLLGGDPVRAVAPNSLTPVTYRVDTGPIASRYLVIEEVDTRGRRHDMGPFSLEGPLGRLGQAFESVERRLDAAGVPPGDARAALRAASRRPARGERAGAERIAQRRGTRVPGVRRLKIEVGQAGPVEVPLEDLHAQGLPSGTPPSRLRLWNRGRRVAFVVDGGRLRFQAGALSTDYTGRNVYVLSWGAPVPAPLARLTVSEDRLEEGHTRIQRDALYVPNAPEDADPWLWDLLVADGSAWPYAYDPEAGDFDLPGFPEGAAGWVGVRLRLVGRSPHLHTVEAAINGVHAGRLTFEGSVPAILSGRVPAAALRASGNQLTLSYSARTGDPEDLGLVYLNALDLAVALPAPAEPVAVERLTSYDPSLPPGLGRAKYLVVSHPDFLQEAHRIAGLQSARGLRAAVVDVERVYDHFSAGIPEADALRVLIRRLARGGRLRYVLLLGDDTFDPRDRLGTGAVGYVPSLVAWDGEFGRVPSENRYADVDGDGAPDVAIGRLPASSPEDAAVMADKIAQAAAHLRNAGRTHIFAVDNQGPSDATPFRAAAESVALRLRGATIRWADLSQGVPEAREALLESLAQGALAVHYFGHAGPEVWADEGLLTVDDVDALSGVAPPAVVFSWSCEALWYQNLFGPSLGEALLLAPGSGALAAFGPSGATDPALQRALFDRLYEPWLRRGVSLGEAIRRAKAEAVRSEPSARPVVEGWNLLGDPALPAPMRHTPF